MAQGFFTVNENTWLVNGYLEDFIKFDRGEKLQDGDTTVSMMDHFLAKVIRDFAKAFPYRNPDTPLDTLNEDERRLQCTTAVWFRNRFNHLKSRINAKKITVGGNAIDPSPSSGPMPQYQPSGSIQLSDPLGSGDEAVANDDSEYPTSGAANTSLYDDDFAVPMDILRSWQGSLDELADLAAKGWADCELPEIERRQQAAPRILRDVLSILARSTGCEAIVIGVSATNHNHNVFRCATTRSIPYLESDRCQEARDHFVDFTTQAFGSSLCANKDCPGPVVYPNPKEENHPVFPEESDSAIANRLHLLEYLSCKLQWQGGGVDVPYAQIEADGHSGEYAMVRQEVLPDGYPIMRSPLAMEDEEVKAWVTHLRACNRDQVEPDPKFQYAMPRPGIHFDDYVPHRPPKTELSYGPGSWAYGLLLSKIGVSEPAGRDDELPMIFSHSTPYASIESSVVDFMRSYLDKEDPAFDLLLALNDHDKGYPAEAPRSHWDSRIEDMPHVRENHPDRNAGFEHLIHENLWLDPAMLDFTDARHFRSSITAITAWCNPALWRHTPSGTIIAGCNGVKWPGLLLILTRINIARFQNASNEFFEHYGSEANGFIERDIKTVNFAVQNLITALQESSTQLHASLAERRTVALEVQASLVADTAHENLPFPRDPESGADRIERWENNPWASETTTSAADEAMPEPDDREELEGTSTAEATATAAVAGSVKRRRSMGDTSPSKRRWSRRKGVTSDDLESESEKSQSPAAAMLRLDISRELPDDVGSQTKAGSTRLESLRSGSASTDVPHRKSQRKK